MEDIEDLLIGSGSRSPPGFRLPLTSVGVNTKRSRNKASLTHKLSQIQDSTSKVPGTQTIFIKTFWVLS
ncbi:hypothetical protein L6164_017198 [Bauhinia variegata]|uniref:Uncharacterized protein n=1 Tax=Bauhinia variegata TaxID=167791 RepID=A0ACB9N749_BAUVA|nr:hypothetical protein L6164_017198 [Bauhinia variegata]